MKTFTIDAEYAHTLIDRRVVSIEFDGDRSSVPFTITSARLDPDRAQIVIGFWTPAGAGYTRLEPSSVVEFAELAETEEQI